MKEDKKEKEVGNLIEGLDVYCMDNRAFITCDELRKIGIRQLSKLKEMIDRELDYRNEAVETHEALMGNKKEK